MKHDTVTAHSISILTVLETDAEKVGRSGGGLIGPGLSTVSRFQDQPLIAHNPGCVAINRCNVAKPACMACIKRLNARPTGAAVGRFHNRTIAAHDECVIAIIQCDGDQPVFGNIV